MQNVFIIRQVQKWVVEYSTTILLLFKLKPPCPAEAAKPELEACVNILRARPASVAFSYAGTCRPSSERQISILIVNGWELERDQDSIPNFFKR